MENNTLVHYGIKGMKWGIRRTDAQLERARGKPKSDDSKVPKKTDGGTSAQKKKSISEMSEDELRKEVNRLNLEKQYRDLMKQMMPPPKKSVLEKGKDFIEDVTVDSARNIGKQLVTYAMGTAVNKTFGSLFDDPQIVNPKKGQKDK